MSGIIEKRRSLHNKVVAQQQQADVFQSQLAQLQALANIGIGCAMIAHEMNNILTPLSNYAQLALNNPDDTALAQKALQKTALNSARAAKILETMLSMVNGEQIEKKSSRLALMIEDIFTCLCRDFAKDRIKVQLVVPADLTVWAVPIQLQQVIMNLILNARDAMLARGGILTIAAGQTDEECTIEVTDTGSGIAPEHIAKIFEPFFTTKSHNTVTGHNGAGLGLAFCKQIVDSHNGRISVTSRHGSGTTFKICLPKP